MYKLLYTTSGSLIQFEDLILDFISSSAVHLALRKQKPTLGMRNIFYARGMKVPNVY